MQSQSHKKANLKPVNVGKGNAYMDAPKKSMPSNVSPSKAKYLNVDTDLLAAFESSHEVIHAYLSGDAEVTEFFNQLVDETGLMMRPLDKTVQQVMVSGSSLIAAGLASNLAQKGQKIALVECGFDETQLQKIFDTRADEGISELLTDKADLEALVINARVFKPTKGLFLFHQGQQTVNWTENALRVKNLVRALSPKFHRIIINVPNLADDTQAMRWAQIMPSQLIMHYEDEYETKPVETAFAKKIIQIV